MGNKQLTVRVIKSTGSWYTVRDEHTGDNYQCRLRGALRLSGSRATNPVVVGDMVDIEIPSTGEEAITITKVLPRKNYMLRRATNLSRESHIIASNLDRVYVVATVDFPPTLPEFIDRVLVTAEAYRIPASIIINKVDIDQGDEFRSIYELTGYPVHLVSATQNIGIDELREEMNGKISLLTGNSGVGKSTLINAIDPSINTKVGDISEYHGLGMHTTTFSELFILKEGGYIIDTPGIKGFGLIDVEDKELWHFFPEMMKYSVNCGFYNCTHVHEPRCAVKQAVMEETISSSRYESYLRILEEDGKYR